MLGLVVSTLLVVYSIQLLLRLLHNRRLARSTGLPYILFPISEQSLFYIVLSEAKAFSYVVNHWLPLWLADYMNASNFKTRWTAKNRMREQYGGAYILVTPTTLTCNVSDASVVSQVCKARRSFPKPLHQYGEWLSMSLILLGVLTYCSIDSWLGPFRCQHRCGKRCQWYGEEIDIIMQI